MLTYETAPLSFLEMQLRESTIGRILFYYFINFSNTLIFRYKRNIHKKDFPTCICFNQMKHPCLSIIDFKGQRHKSDVETKYQAEHERVRQWLEENDMM